ncbi:caspase domain-containing protein [Streptomyces sp. NPDC002018]|uniref:caspase family protein n=1 Tax=Streptomyces sp. NPDC002018 TaxID=3364629 RepID=UPI0036C8F423
MAEPERIHRALLIGNSEFPDDPKNLRPLMGPVTDVRMLHEALTHPVTGLHRVGSVKRIVNGASGHINDELTKFFERATAHEQLLLYYSGHGRLDLQNRLRLCASDTTVALLRTRSVRHELINELIDDCAARSIVVILDCCFSGVATVKGTDPAGQLSGRGRFVMTSSSHAGLSSDAQTEQTASPFTRYLIEALRFGASGDGGYATVYDVYTYVHEQIRASGQIPHMKAAGGAGHVPLARRPDPSMRPADGAQPEAAGPSQGGDGVTDGIEIRPTFTDPRGNQTLLQTESDFTGVLHVMLPQRRMILTTHRDQIAEAASGPSAMAQVHSRARTYRDGLHVKVRGKKPIRIWSSALDAAVQFTLPEGAGTVGWTEEQVQRFLRAKAVGRWPSVPSAGRQRADTGTEADDEGYAHLASATSSAYRHLLMCFVLGTLAFVQGNLVAHAEGPLPWLTIGIGTGLAFIFAAAGFITGLITFGRAKDARNFRKVHRLLHDPALPVTPMLMLIERRTEDVHTGDGIIVPVKTPWALLWDENARLAPPARRGAPASDSPMPSPIVSVPILNLYSKDVRHRDTARGADGAQRVEVVGLPVRGQWLAIRTEEGVIWPRGKAE